MSKYIPSIKAVHRQNQKPNKDNEYPIAIRLTYKRKSRYFHLGLSVSKENWNKDTRKVRASHKMYAVINDIMEKTLQEIEECALLTIQKNKTISVDALRGTISQEVFPENNQEAQNCFIDYGLAWVDQLKDQERIRYANKMKYTFNKLRRYHGEDPLPFEELDVTYLNKYQQWLKTVRGNTQNTIHSNFKNLKTVYRHAISEGLADQGSNPFFLYKVPKTKPKKTHLKLDQIQAISDLNLPKKELIWHVRNAFLFSFWCGGIRISDLVNLRWKNITNDGFLRYDMSKVKTNEGHRELPLLPPAKNILDQYRTKVKHINGYIFPFLNEDIDYSPDQRYRACASACSTCNIYLKKIAGSAGINKRVTTHTARHSFTGCAEEMGLSLEEIQGLLGHVSITTTEIYRDSFRKHRDEKAFTKFYDNIKSHL